MDDRTLKLMTQALRASQAVPGIQQRAPGTLYVEGFGASPPRVINNRGGQAWNTVKDVLAGVTGVADMRAAQSAKEEQEAALAEAMSNPQGMTPQTMLRLRQLGVDADTLKLVAPKENELGMNQIAQYGQTPQGMRTINQLRPGTFSDEYIAQAEAAMQKAQEAEMSNKIRVAQESRAPQEPRSRTELDVILNGSPEERQRLIDARMLMSGKGIYDAEGRVIPKPAAVGKGKNAPVDPKAELAKMKAQAAELESMLNDPRADTELFSDKQAIVIPAGEAAGKGDNPSVAGTLTAQYARTKKSPMATRLERWGQEQALTRIKDLYPASNADIQMLLSMQPRPGDSRASMAQYLQLHNKIIEKAEAGVYGAPAEPNLTEAEDVWGDIPVTERPNGWEKWPADAVQAWVEAQ